VVYMHGARRQAAGCCGCCTCGSTVFYVAYNGIYGTNDTSFKIACPHLRGRSTAHWRAWRRVRAHGPVCAAQSRHERSQRQRHRTYLERGEMRVVRLGRHLAHGGGEHVQVLLVGPRGPDRAPDDLCEDVEGLRAVCVRCVVSTSGNRGRYRTCQKTGCRCGRRSTAVCDQRGGGLETRRRRTTALGMITRSAPSMMPWMSTFSSV
jgi:hypothetical protein